METEAYNRSLDERVEWMQSRGDEMLKPGADLARIKQAILNPVEYMDTDFVMATFNSQAPLFNNFIPNLFGKEKRGVETLGADSSWNRNEKMSSKKRGFTHETFGTYLHELQGSMLAAIEAHPSRSAYVPVLPDYDGMNSEGELARKLKGALGANFDDVRNVGETRFYVDILITTFKDLLDKGYNYWDLWS